MFLLRCLYLLATVAPFAFADVKFTSPAAGASAAGGTTLSVKWTESGSSPPISSFTSYQLFLCAGGNDPTSFIVLTSLQDKGTFSAGNSASGTIGIGVGASATNAYFLKIISAGSTGTVTNYSPRFSLTGMTGSFPNNVAAAVTKISGTDGPKTENSAQANQAAGAGASAGPSGAYAVPYTMQTGSIKYAPMQKPPGTAITAKNPTPLYPTSSVQFASTYLPMPSQITTMTAPLTGSAQSRANTAAPAVKPSDDMQRYLNRWKD